MGAKNLWDEICVQIRSEHPLTESYQDHVRKRLSALMPALRSAERLALWFDSYPAECFQADEDRVSIDQAIASAAEEDQLIDHVMSAHVMPVICNYQNKRIREITGE